MIIHNFTIMIIQAITIVQETTANIIIRKALKIIRAITKIQSSYHRKIKRKTRDTNR